MRHNRLERRYAARQQVLQKRADDIKREPEDDAHDADKCRNTRIFSGQEPVDPVGALLLLADMRLHDAFADQLLDEIKTHIRDGRRAVKPALLLHLTDDVRDHFLLILLELQRIDNPLIALNDLRRRKPLRNPGCLRVVLNQMRHSVQTAMNGAAVLVR